MKIIRNPITIVIAILILSILISIFYYFNQINHYYVNESAQSFEIREGQSRSEIVLSLRGEGFIYSSWPILLYVRLHKTVFLPGVYTIPIQYNTKDLFVLFGNESKKEKKLTIPEGWSKEQIAEKIVDYGLDKTKFLALTSSDEGKLFPDTYFIGEKTTEEDLIKRMKENYLQKVSKLTVVDASLILASIVEREAKNDNERSLIAGIYQNRLNIGMALEADPTVQYAKYTDLGLAPIENGKHDYWAPITATDYKGVKSSYNTYLHSGLPPGPICNPGIKSITATVNPAKTDDFYFFHTKSGQIITSGTLDEHNANKTKYLK